MKDLAFCTSQKPGAGQKVLSIPAIVETKETNEPRKDRDHKRDMGGIIIVVQLAASFRAYMSSRHQSCNMHVVY